MSMPSDQQKKMLQLDKINVVLKGKDGQETTGLRNISFSARSSEITAIVGPSGSGKSTLIRLLNRLSDPASGTVYLDGRDITQINPIRLRSRVAMVLQKPFMFEGSVLTNLQRPFLYRSEPLPTAMSEDVLSVMELSRISSALLERDARSLSLGEQQRVSLARALITSPQVLLLDEPTSALDRPTADHLAETFREICHSRQLTVILVTHDLRLAERIADHLIYLEAGQIREMGTAAELLNNPHSEEMRRFLGYENKAEIVE